MRIRDGVFNMTAFDELLMGIISFFLLLDLIFLYTFPVFAVLTIIGLIKKWSFYNLKNIFIIMFAYIIDLSIYIYLDYCFRQCFYGIQS